MEQHDNADILYDVRLIDRHVRQGVLTREDVDRRRAAAADLAGQCDTLRLEQMGHGALGKPSRE